MSNKQQLQTNNTKYASLIETLRGKAAGTSGEDVTEETNAYTAKISELETAVAALEAELEGKASGGSGGNIETCNVTINNLSLRMVTLISWSSLSDGVITSNILRSSLESMVTLQNVIKNSSITILYSSEAGPFPISNTEGVTFLHHDMIAQAAYAIVASVSSDSALTLNALPCCFAAGTQILTTLDGQTQAIESIKADDLVVSYNIETNESYLAKVKKLIIHENTTDLATVYFDNGASVTMNAYHPLYTDNGWHSITNHNDYDTLVIGDNVKTINGWSNIIDIDRYTSEPITTYNLDIININEEPDIDTNDTYYANGIVAHNGFC